jgi:hypothetical protein
MLIILFAGIIFTTFMFVYRKVSEGQTFDMERYAKTLGYVAILALGSYVATGLVPDFAAILVQLEQGIPNAPELLALVTAIVFGIINFFLKKTGIDAPVQTVKPATAPAGVSPPVSNYGIGKVLGIYGHSALANPPLPAQTFDINMIPTLFFNVEVVRSGTITMQLIIDNIIQKKWMPNMQGLEPYQTTNMGPVGAIQPYAFNIWYNEQTPGEHTINILLGYYDVAGKNPVWVSNDVFKVTLTGKKFLE